MNVGGIGARAVSIGGGGPTLSFGAINLSVSNVLYPKAYSINMGSGNVDLYTVPANRMALWVDTVVTNPTGSGGAMTTLVQAKVSGTYHTFDFVSAGLAAGSYGRTAAQAPFLLLAGEIASVNLSTTGASVWPSIIEFDASANIARSVLFSLASGNNTVFTVPAGKTVQFVAFPSASSLPQVGTLWYWNNSGGTPTVSMNVVPNAGSPSLQNQIFTGSIANQQMAQQTFYGGLNPGDFINVNTSSATATQTAYVIYTLQ
jgi:hypothetical protein